MSRKTINEAETRGDGFVERRIEAAVRALTLVTKARARLSAQAALHRAEGDADGARFCRGIFWGFAACWSMNLLTLIGLLTTQVLKYQKIE